MCEGPEHMQSFAQNGEVARLFKEAALTKNVAATGDALLTIF